MESTLENQRSAHEERERIVDSITKEFLAEKRTHKARINSDQRVKKLLEVSWCSFKQLIKHKLL